METENKTLVIITNSEKILMFQSGIETLLNIV